MSLLRRMILMNQSSSTPPEPVLPYDAEIEYLEIEDPDSIYRGYIDTEIKAKSTISVSLDFEILNSTASSYPFGARISINSGRFDFCNGVSSGSYWSFGNTVSTKLGLLSVGKYNFSNRNNHKVLNVTGDDTRDYTANGSDFSTDNNIYLFGMNNNGTYANARYLRCMGGQIYDNDVLVRDYIPVRVGQVGYLYDKVSGNLFGNANSQGSFILGQDV